MRSSNCSSVKHWLAVIIPFLMVLESMAQPVPSLFNYLTTEDGLPQNSVTSVIQGQHGFMWVGTQDGLCSYDGHQFKTYQSAKGDTTAPTTVWIALMKKREIARNTFSAAKRIR